MPTTKNNNQPKRPPWRHLNSSSGLLIAGLLILNVAVFLQPTILDAVLAALARALDFRLWPWWYFLVLLALVAFSVKWYLLTSAWNDLDAVDKSVAQRFIPMSTVLACELLGLLVLHASGLLWIVYRAVREMFRFGTYSLTAAIAFFTVCLLAALTYYVVKEWFVLAFSSN